MKKLLITLISAVTLGTALPVLAGPDWQAIEQARQNKRAQVAPMDKRTPEANCAARRLVLPLDHGPRAQSTPYLNGKRKESFEADLKACKEAAARGTAQ